MNAHVVHMNAYVVHMRCIEVCTMCDQGRETAAEKRYRKLLLSGLELNKYFYFSYTYNLARTLQANVTADAPADPFDSMFVWNEYLSRCKRHMSLMHATNCDNHR